MGYPGLDDGSSAHGARFQGDIEHTILQSPGSKGIGGLGDGDHLRMGGGILELLPLVVGPGEDPFGKRKDHRSHRNLILLGRLDRLIQRETHVFEMKRVPGIAPGHAKFLGKPGARSHHHS